MLSTPRERTVGVETQKENNCLTTWVDEYLMGDIDATFFAMCLGGSAVCWFQGRGVVGAG